jgi:uncharacterized protein
MTATTDPSPRHVSLDTVRGIAVMGILAVNIASFSMPDSAYINPLSWGEPSQADLIAWAGTFVLIEGKMRGLFSLLFGASMLLVIDRAKAREESGASVHFRRLFWLALFGLLHHYLIWQGDILFHYAVVGSVAYFFTRSSTQKLWGMAIALLVASFLWHALQMGGVYAQTAMADAPGASAELRQIAAELRAGFAPPDDPNALAEAETYRGGYEGIVAHRLESGATALFFFLMLYGLETLGLMLLGMALLRSGFLTLEWASSRYHKWMLWAYLLGLPPLAALAAWNWSIGFDGLATFSTWLAWAEPFKYVVLIGHAALIMLCVRSLSGGRLASRLAATGRSAFTNYLGTSLIMTTVFYGYGLGLYGHLSRLDQWLVVLLMWALMLLWSKPWLERFRYGPFEWLWRSLSRGKLEPMRKEVRPALAAE